MPLQSSRVADLLECLVQISALRETVKRLEALVRRFPLALWVVRTPADRRSAAEELSALSEAELLWGVRLRAILATDRPLLPGFDPEALVARPAFGDRDPEVVLSRFRTRREESLELLGRCSAADLERRGRLPEGGEPSIADAVAIMLAADTERFGRIRECLERAAEGAASASRAGGTGEEKGDDA
jgi:hypothetical protein